MLHGAIICHGECGCIAYHSEHQLTTSRPNMRRILTTGQKEVKFEDFFVPFTTTLSLNYPYPEDCILISKASHNPNESPILCMDPGFEHHVRKLGNWTVGKEFRQTFPELVDVSVRIKSP